MQAQPKIALVWQSATPCVTLRDELSALDGQPSVHVFADPVGEIERLRRLRPQVLLFGHDAPDAEHAGMLKMLRATLGDCGVVLATSTPQCGEVQALAQRVDARLLPMPATRAALASAIGQALQTPPRDGRQALLGLIRGLGDEVNNPLLAALGQLRLLAAELEHEPGKLAKLRAAENSLRRVEGSVARLRHVQRADELGRPSLRVDLGALVAEVDPHAGAAAHREPLPVLGDPDLLRQMLRDLDHVARELAGPGTSPQWLALRVGDDAVLRVSLTAARVADWQLPRTFEPYYLGRLLRGTCHGLALFAVQQIVLAHGGAALVRRRGAGIEFELTLPTPRG